MKNSESFNKYVCGLLDGDGCFTVNFRKSSAGEYYNTTILIYLDLEKTNRHSKRLLEEIRDYFGAGNINEGSSTHRYIVSGKQVRPLVDRIKKHLVVKGQHAERSLEVYEKYRGTTEVTEAKKEELREYLKWSRENTTSLKPKKHISLAWFAGFIDSDGCIKGYTRSRVNLKGETKYCYNGILSFCQHPKDKSAIELIAHSYGRESYMNAGYMNLRFHFGNRTKSTVTRVLKPLLKHLVLKRWEAEQVIYNLKTPRPPAETE